MGRGSGNPVVLSVVSNGDKMSRRWKIKISMIECGSLNMGKHVLKLILKAHAANFISVIPHIYVLF